MGRRGCSQKHGQRPAAWVCVYRSLIYKWFDPHVGVFSPKYALPPRDMCLYTWWVSVSCSRMFGTWACASVHISVRGWVRCMCFHPHFTVKGYKWWFCPILKSLIKPIAAVNCTLLSIVLYCASASAAADTEEINAIKSRTEWGLVCTLAIFYFTITFSTFSIGCFDTCTRNVQWLITGGVGGEGRITLMNWRGDGDN